MACPARRNEPEGTQMNLNPLDTARAMLAGDRGLLAMDESIGTCDKRFAAAGVPRTGECRRAYRELIASTPRLGEFISGVILFDETIRQETRDGTPFAEALTSAGMIPGIKVDRGAKSLAGHPGESVTEGLDGLRERLAEYAALGARFAKWRAVIALGAGGGALPSRTAVAANAHALARYAALTQEAGLVPVIEPEVLMDGNHSLERCGEVTEEVLSAVFDRLRLHGVALEAMILKPNMVVPGSASAAARSVDEVAAATLQCLLRVVPAAVPGIAFLSGGQSGQVAAARLNAMHAKWLPARTALPWTLTFSFARAIQHPALQIWGGQDAHRAAAQAALLHRARCCHAAVRGEYDAAMEDTELQQAQAWRPGPST